MREYGKKENDYEEFLEAEKTIFSDTYKKYSITISLSGSVDSTYGGDYLGVCFSLSLDQSSNNELQFKIESDGSFSHTETLTLNLIPKDIFLSGARVIPRAAIEE